MLAPVKVNLTLHVGAARADGYHPLTSVCAFPAIGDAVTLGAAEAGFALDVDGPEAAGLAGLDPSDNLVLRAAHIIADAAQASPRRLTLTKRVPPAGGIAGGTADAAAALVLLNRAGRRPLADADLIALSRRLGADGPVCTAAALAGGGVWLAEGDGARVRRLPGPPPHWCVLANDRVPVPTGRVFARFDQGPPGGLAQPAGDLRTARGVLNVTRAGRNDLRPPALSVAPGIGAVEAAMRAQPGCRAARMSGSGGTVFGLFASRVAAVRAERRLRAGGAWSASGRLLG